MAKHNWKALAAEVWDILAEDASHEITLSYSELGQRIGLHHRSVPHALAKIQQYCLEHGKPPLQALVINKRTRRPGEGFVSDPGVNFEDIMDQVTTWPWGQEPNPFAQIEKAQTVDVVSVGPDVYALKTVLLAWNPTKWQWDDYRQQHALLQSGKQPTVRWSCGNTKSIQQGERALLVRVGLEPRGLVATGTVVKGSYEAAHWNGQRAAANESSMYVDVQLDRLASVGEAVLLHRDSLLAATPTETTWSPQGSGIHIASGVAATVEELLTSADAPLPEEVEQSKVHQEGAARRVNVNAYERSSAARQACIDHYGTTCTVCEKSLEDLYGDVASGFTHVHHLVQLSAVGSEYVVDPIADLRPVCPNCHAMIHLGAKNRSIEEVKDLLREGREK